MEYARLTKLLFTYLSEDHGGEINFPRTCRSLSRRFDVKTQGPAAL